MLLVLLATTSWQVAAHGPLLRLDRRLRGALAHADAALPAGTLRPAVDGVAEFLSDLGGSLVAVPVLLGCALLAAGALLRARATRWWLPLPAAAVAAVLIPLLVVPAKAYFARPGPDGVPLLPDQWGWYPSGHTATASIAYGAAALLLATATARPRVRTALHCGAVLLALGVGVGLMWRDYHWFLDVLASWSLAGIVLWALGRLLARWRPGR
ncbi:phosphatase PAP2 family protein [Streptomyces sp. NPDC092296]|uniref:phosphatase PAP2 family protein n=1 Tax=Streptomyces sp. NPDC092296 TaxID=3366012 RepID=UPI003803FD80